jgi:uncharacterized RDD family membrane protein YckC
MEQTQTVGTNEVKYAGFWIRFVAAIVDSLVFYIIYSVASFIIGLVVGFVIGIAYGTSFDFEKMEVWFKLIDFILSIVFSFMYSILMIYKNNGATFGKMMVGIKVASANPESLSLGRIILRETVGQIASTVIFCIGYIMVAFSAKKQGLHDMIAKTVVVYKDPNKKVGVGLIVAIIIAVLVPIISIVGILASVVLVSLNTAQLVGDDAKNKTLLASLRSQITVEELAGKKFTCDTSVADQSLDSSIIYKSIKASNLQCLSDDKSYAISFDLNKPKPDTISKSINPKSYCVDSSGYIGNGVSIVDSKTDEVVCQR